MRQLISPAKPRARRGQRGATLIEAMISCVVLAGGTAAVTQLLSHVSQANRRMAFQSLANDLASELMNQVADARCDTDAINGNLSAATVDSGLWAAINAVGVWQLGPGLPATSVVQTVGTSAAMPLVDRGIPLRIRYRVTAATTIAGRAPPSFDLEVEVREILNDVARDNLAVTTGFWIRNIPFKKVCNRRMEAGGRGEL